MSEKFKLKIPKINSEFLKNNLLIIVSVATLLLLLIVDIAIWLSGQGIIKEIRVVKEKKEKIKQVNEKLEKIVQDKPHLKIEEFARKVPVGAVPPLAAIQQAGLIINSTGAQGQILANESSGAGSSSGSGSGGQTVSGSEAEGLILVGSKSLSKQEFNFKFTADYEDFMKILEKLPLAEPLIVVSSFTVERLDSEAEGQPIPGTPFFKMPVITGDLRKLSIELKLATFTELLPGELIWSPAKK